MKAFRSILFGLILSAPLASEANEQEVQLSDTVNSFMVETYNFVLNINLLIELCTLDTYLDINTNSKAFNDKLHENIRTFAKYGKVEDYSANKVAAEVETKFKAFLQGVRYGGFIADNFIKTQYPKGVCTEEIKSDLKSKIEELVKTDEFQLSEFD